MYGKSYYVTSGLESGERGTSLMAHIGFTGRLQTSQDKIQYSSTEDFRVTTGKHKEAETGFLAEYSSNWY